MAVRNTKTIAIETLRERGRHPAPLDKETTALRDAEELDDFDTFDSDMGPPREPDPREVDDLTDRIFQTVLARYGWEQHGGRIEHVGSRRERRR